MSNKNLKQIEKDLKNFAHQAWTAASLSRILKDSLEYGSNINKPDIIYLAAAVDEMLQKQKYKISNIKKNLFGI